MQNTIIAKNKRVGELVKKLFKNTFLFGLGAIGYSLIEKLWRGYTHWTMGLAGGTCFLALYNMNIKLRKKNVLHRCFVGSIVITTIEFIAGCIVNLAFRMDVWDYSDRRFNVLGQICLLYSFLWFLLCIPVLCLSSALYRAVKRR